MASSPRAGGAVQFSRRFTAAGAWPPSAGSRIKRPEDCYRWHELRIGTHVEACPFPRSTPFLPIYNTCVQT